MWIGFAIKSEVRDDLKVKSLSYRTSAIIMTSMNYGINVTLGQLPPTVKNISKILIKIVTIQFFKYL